MREEELERCRNRLEASDFMSMTIREQQQDSGREEGP